VCDDSASLHVKISGILGPKALLYDLSESVLACFLPFKLCSFQLLGFPHLLVVIKIVPTEIFLALVVICLLILLFLFFLADDL
jgi:hypothetical protein